MSAIASQITGVSIVYSTVCLSGDQMKHQGPASLAFVRGTHWLPVNCPHKGQWRGKCFHLMTSSWYKGGLNIMFLFGWTLFTIMCHYIDVIMSLIASHVTGVSIVYSTICSGADQRRHQSPASLAAQRARNAENASIWWRHHGIGKDGLKSCFYLVELCEDTGPCSHPFSTLYQTSHRKILRSLEPARLGLNMFISLRHMTGVSGQPNFKAIGKFSTPNNTDHAPWNICEMLRYDVLCYIKTARRRDNQSLTW